MSKRLKTSPETKLVDLPANVFRHILKYLSIHETFRLRAVSKFLHENVVENIFDFTIAGDEVILTSYAETLSLAASIQSLRVMQCLNLSGRITNDLLPCITPCFRNLLRIHLRDLSPSDRGILCLFRPLMLQDL